MLIIKQVFHFVLNLFVYLGLFVRIVTIELGDINSK